MLEGLIFFLPKNSHYSIPNCEIAENLYAQDTKKLQAVIGEDMKKSMEELLSRIDGNRRITNEN